MSTEDYRAKIQSDKRRRLEKVALSVLSGICANPHGGSRPVEDVTRAIVLAKDFIKQIDEEFKDEKRK